MEIQDNPWEQNHAVILELLAPYIAKFSGYNHQGDPSERCYSEISGLRALIDSLVF